MKQAECLLKQSPPHAPEDLGITRFNLDLTLVVFSQRGRALIDTLMICPLDDATADIGA
jgi:hypothetical protein